MIKASLFLNKRHHHSNLLSALKIPKIEILIVKRQINLLKRSFNIISSYTELNIRLLSSYLATHYIPSGTLISNIINNGFDPLKIFLGSCPNVPNNWCSDGIIDSIRYLLRGRIYPGSEKHELLKKISRAF